MTTLGPPNLDPRRASDFERELLERARAWIPSWGADDERDFGRALLKIAARFSSEVAERLDGAGAKYPCLVRAAVFGRATRTTSRRHAPSRRLFFDV